VGREVEEELSIPQLKGRISQLEAELSSTQQAHETLWRYIAGRPWDRAGDADAALPQPATPGSSLPVDEPTATVIPTLMDTDTRAESVPKEVEPESASRSASSQAVTPAITSAASNSAEPMQSELEDGEVSEVVS